MHGWPLAQPMRADEMADKPLKALDVILEDTTFSTGDKAANVNVARVGQQRIVCDDGARCVLGLVKVSVVFALISLTDIAFIIVKMSLNKASGTVQCAYLKSYAKLSLPQVDKAPQTQLATFLSLQQKPTHQPVLVGKNFFESLFYNKTMLAQLV